MKAYWDSLQADLSRPFALFFSIAFAAIFSQRFLVTHAMIFLLLAFRFWLMSVFVANRFPPAKPVPLVQRGIAYASKSVPFFYHNPLLNTAGSPFLFGDTLALAGALLSTWGVIDLGRRFGIAPAKRGEVCRSGVYRWLRHPIYAGYALLELDCVFLNPANLVIYLISMASLVVRSYLEDRVLQEA